MAVTRGDPLMHAPCYTVAHCLPAAGGGERSNEVFRFNRVTPYYPPDPCIRPNEGDLMCPPDCTKMKRNDLLPYAGSPSESSDVFRFYSVRKPKPESICSMDANVGSLPCSSLGVIQDVKQCPCINRSDSIPGVSRSCNINPNRMDFDLRPCQSGTQYQRQLREIDGNSLRMRDGARAPTPYKMSGHFQNRSLQFAGPDHSCQNPYYSAPYLCRPVFNRKYLLDCPEQDGPHPDTYTFL